MSNPDQSEPPTRRVFISYSQHDPASHSARVLAFAQALAADGLDVELDQYHQHESMDWPRWCEERLRPENSDFVLMICSSEYKRRIEGRVAPDKGRGVFWEGSIIDDYLYEDKANERFIPILLDKESEDSLPRIVRGWTWCKVSAFGIASGDVGYTNLYRLLTVQPTVIKPKVGETKVLVASNPLPLSSSEVTPMKPINLPYPSLGPVFKGREDFINAIRDSFAGNPARAQAITARHAIHGLGGIGKTRTAIEYAWRFAADYTALLFVSAATSLDFRTNIAALCQILKVAEGVTDDTLRFEEAINWLRDSSHRGWLLIVDNLDTIEAAGEAGKTLGTLEGGHVLITGRLSEWPGFIESRRLDVLDREAATEFLLARTADKRQPHDSDTAEARALAEELDGLALALEQAAAFIRRHALQFSDYLQRWRSADQRVRQWHDARTMQYDRPLAATWQTTIDILPPHARSLLSLISWLAPEPLPRFLFDHDAAPQGVRHLFVNKEVPHKILRILSEDDQADSESALAALRDFSLLQPARAVAFPNEGHVHRVVALITRERQSAEEQARSLSAAGVLVNAAAVGETQDVRSWPVWNALRPHVSALVNFTDEAGLAEPTRHLMNKLGLLLKTKAQYAEAEPVYRRVLSISEKEFGIEDPKVATVLNNLALLLQATNRLSEAEPLMRRALAIDEASYGPEHPEVAADLNNLAQLLLTTNRLLEAEPLMRRTLAINEKLLGLEDPKVAISLSNLGALLQETNRLSEAEPMIRRALVIDEASYGPEHPEVATDLNNLAQLLQGTNRLSEAEPLMRRALAIDEASYGPEHPNVARDLNNLSQLLQETNRLSEAEPLMRRALAIYEKSYGSGHTEIAAIFNNLAQLLQATDRRSEAEPLMRRALAIDEMSLGLEHPAVARDLNNLARLLQTTNRSAEAEPLMRRHLVIFLRFSRTTGHVHPHLRNACINYANLLSELKLSTEKIGERFAELAEVAQFDGESFRELWERLFGG